MLNPDAAATARRSAAATRSRRPVAAFPAHWAPVWTSKFYTGSQFPAKYRNGAFIAFHGSWNRSPMPQAGYNVTFQPFAGGKPSGDVRSASRDGFAGKDPLTNPGDAVARAGRRRRRRPTARSTSATARSGKIWRGRIPAALDTHAAARWVGKTVTGRTGRAVSLSGPTCPTRPTCPIRSRPVRRDRELFSVRPALAHHPAGSRRARGHHHAGGRAAASPESPRHVALMLRDPGARQRLAGGGRRAVSRPGHRARARLHPRTWKTLRHAVWRRGVSRLEGEPVRRRAGRAARAPHLPAHAAAARLAAILRRHDLDRDRNLSAAHETIETLQREYAFLRLADLASLAFCGSGADGQAQEMGYEIRLEAVAWSCRPIPTAGATIPLGSPAVSSISRHSRRPPTPARPWTSAPAATITGNWSPAVSCQPHGSSARGRPRAGR